MDEEVHEVTLVELVSQYTDLEPYGKELRAHCPFHEEKTPSFYVNVEKNVWHCFGCGEGGDDVVFYMYAEGVSQAHALRKLRGPLSEAERHKARTVAMARHEKKRLFEEWAIQENTKLCKQFRDLEDHRDDAILACEMIRAHPFWFSYAEREQYLDHLAYCIHTLVTLTWWLDILTYDKYMHYRQMLYQKT
jgi:hypothetical protein